MEPLIAETCEKYDEPLEIGEEPNATFDIIDTVRVKRWSPFSGDGPDLSPNSPFAADVRAMLCPDDSRGRQSPRGT